jgi:transcriptional regulator with XRE-family HTH domain
MKSEEIFKNIERLRNDKGWTAYKLSQEAGISHSALYKWHERKSLPTFDLLHKLCDALQIKLSVLLFGLETDALSEEQRRVMELWNGLNRRQKNAILDTMRSMTKQ